jgi:hypothetical protein
MSLPPFVYKNAIQSIQYLYDLYGYEQLLKEINLVHHIHQHTLSEPSVSHENESTPAPKPQSSEEETKNIVIQPKESADKKGNDPVLITDEVRCTQTLSNGQRCGVRRKKSSEYCQRHHDMIHKPKQ